MSQPSRNPSDSPELWYIGWKNLQTGQVGFGLTEHSREEALSLVAELKSKPCNAHLSIWAAKTVGDKE